jgi:hypothetical protein
MNKDVRRTIHHSQLPEAPADQPLAVEWGTYRQSVARLLSGGHEGEFVLIKGEEIIGLYDTWECAREAGLRLYLCEPFMVHRVCTYEPLLRLRGYSLPWPSLRSQS